MQYPTVLSIISIGLLQTTVFTNSCHLRELDLCAAAVAGAKAVFVNDAEIDKYCAQIRDAKECVIAYTNNCTTPVQKEMISYALPNGQEEKAEKFCVRGDQLRNNYLKHAPCLAKTQPEGKKCSVDVQAALEKLDEIPIQGRFTMACCTYTKYKKCVRDIVEAQCGTEAFEYGMMVVKLASSNIIDVTCGSFENNPQCVSLPPPPGTAPKGNGKSLVGKLVGVYTKA